MKTIKRLFLFAGFDKDCIIDVALVYHVKQLSKYGDVVLCMDCDCKKSEIDKIKKYTIHTITKRHGEYDFGSYKRCFQYAYDKGILKNYDFLYLVNDSVFGPTLDIKQTLKDCESKKADACSITVSQHKTHEFMESWFVCLTKQIFMSKWFYDFIISIKAEERKTYTTVKYEHGLSNLIHQNGHTWSGLLIKHGRFTYNEPKYLFKHGCPFVKKMSFTRHNGTLGNEIKYILKHCDKQAHNAIIKSAKRLYGTQYMRWLLTYNPIKILNRKITYALKKLKNGGI